MKILHVASFNGNIGDNAHHSGFRRKFEELIDRELKWDNLEMRKFYRAWGELRFDETFVELANDYDLIVIGGGNFFEICHEYSRTGCTVDLPIEILKKINPPILFNALGFDIKKGYTTQTKNNFKKFIDFLISNDKYFITFRNDGSEKEYIELYGKIEERINIVPDGGFFYEITGRKRTIQKKYIGINLACDMLEKRLKYLSYDEFIVIMSSVLTKFIEKNPEYTIKFFPHIYSDFKPIYDIMTHLKDRYVKYNIEVISYVTGQGKEDEFYEHYLECDLVTGMRFHTNVCGIALGIPTIGITTYPKVAQLYEGLNLSHRNVDLNSNEFEEKYLKILEDTILRREKVLEENSRIKKEIDKKREVVHLNLKKWLLSNVK